jgi:hypothetical protein
MLLAILDEKKLYYVFLRPRRVSRLNTLYFVWKLGNILLNNKQIFNL